MPVKTLNGVTVAGGDVSVTQDSSCALSIELSAYCWGSNQHGAIGDGTTSDSNTPVKVVGLPRPAAQIATGNGTSCAIVITGVVYCWGHNGFGELGNGTTVSDSTTPVQVTGLAGPVVVLDSQGAFDTCALISSPSEVQCWGNNSGDELGDGTNGGQSNTPQVVQGL